MARSTWKLDESLTCPQCERYNALTAQAGGKYLCRDCGYLFRFGDSRCEGCEGPITKRCGLHCYDSAPARVVGTCANCRGVAMCERGCPEYRPVEHVR